MNTAEIQEYAALRLAMKRMLAGLHATPPRQVNDEEWLRVDRALTAWLAAHDAADFEDGDMMVFEYVAALSRVSGGRE